MTLSKAKRCVCASLAVYASTLGCAQASPQLTEGDLFELSLGELLNLEVTSLSRKSQAISRTAAAVFVITNDDIRRSGVTTIADALRLAPGVQVANIDGNKWAVTARGFNGLFSNKLLVLMDGRTVYSPLFSGTFWDTQDAILQDIERIEVIRGPGATLWGSNAVNGVINIITREAGDSAGGYLEAGVGNQERGFVSLRHGASLGELGDYRVYGKFFERDGNELALDGAATGDDWRQGRVGFRADIDAFERDRFTLQGDAYRGKSGETSVDLLLTPPYTPLVDQDQELTGFNILGRWERDFSTGDQLSVQSYFDRETRDWPFIGHDRYTIDFDLDYRIRRFEGHDLVLGLGYRRFQDDFDNEERLSINPESRKDKLFSAFIQDDITLTPDRLVLTMGLKLERNDYTGLEYQPNMRLLWTPDERRSLWASVTRGVRIPGRADRDSMAFLDVIPPGAQMNPLPIAVRVEGNSNFESEDLLAYELGFKFQATQALAMDIAAYVNNYDNLRSVSTNPPVCNPAGAFPFCLFDPRTTNLEVNNLQTNGRSARNMGLEFALDWRPSARWRWQANYTQQDQELKTDGPGTGVSGVDFFDPESFASVRASFNPRPDVDVDLWLRYQDGVESVFGAVDALTSLDARVAWRPGRRSEVALIARNLQDDARLQYISESQITPPIAMQRSVHMTFTIDF